MLDVWTGLIINIAFLSILLLIATFIRSKVKIIQNLFIPNSIIAGILGFIFLTLNKYFFKFDILMMTADKLKDYIYHLLAIVFITLVIKNHESSKSKNAFSTSFLFGIGYGLQAFFGFGLSLIFFSKIFPQFNPLNGILVQLGFSNSPATANSIAKGWQFSLMNNSALGPDFLEKSGIIYSSDIGITFGAIGFLIATIVGIFLINYGIKKGYTTFLKDSSTINNSIKKGFIKDPEKQPIAGKQTMIPDSIDTLSFHIALIAVIYIITYFLFKFLLFIFGFLPEKLNTLAKALLSYNFIFAALIAMVVKKIFKLLKIDFLIDNGINERIAGTCIDYMVTSALAAISIIVVVKFIIPILSISVIVGLITFLYCAYLGSRSFDDYQFERIVTIFSIATGTMATGLAFLRVMDPHFKSPVANDIMYGSGLVFFLTIPIMLLINLPLMSLIEGNTLYNWIGLGAVGLYSVIIIVIWRLTGLLKFQPVFKLWNKNK